MHRDSTHAACFPCRRGAWMPLAFTLALSCGAAAQNVERVLLADTQSGVRAWFSPDVGLWLEGFGGQKRVVIGRGSEPRFDAQGQLWFTRSEDDGHEIRRRETWFLARGTAVPVRMHGTGPAYRLPAPSPRPLGAPVKVVIDAGHGGSDPGALGNGLREADINLAVALRLEAWLALDAADARGGGDWTILMTRRSDTDVSLASRANAANAFGAASFLSIHMNSFTTSSANGSETFCYTGQEGRAAGLYRNRVQSELLSAWGLTNRGVKTANFYVLRNTSMPAVLMEGGFITNTVDASKMKSAASIDRLALGLLWATQEHHGFTRYTPSSGPTTGTLTGVVYDASQGTGARIVDASIVLSDGASQRSVATTGAFSFALPPGTYSYVASAPGFAPAALTRTVVANQTIWGSPGLRPMIGPSIEGPFSTVAGNPLQLTVRADAQSPVLVLIGSTPQLLTIGNFGVSVPDLTTSVAVSLGVVPASGTLAASIPTPVASKGARVLMQPFAFVARAPKLGNAAAFELK
ncbi:MAG: N-acetylmuramoyl-L-alanine amidase [Planctomycetes bacterium]|nr:N-acetylmuramoyl-L-alanine amidase [Planctomycetota bacterium]